MELRFNCPFCIKRGHTPDTKRKLHINPAKNKGHCFRCGYATVHAHLMAKRYGLAIDPTLVQVMQERQQSLTPPTCRLPDFYTRDWEASMDGKVAYRYLRHRGLSRTLIGGYELGYVPYGKPYGSRVVIPMYHNGEIVYWQARDWTERREPKYIGPDLDKPLFNFDRAAHTGAICLVEGPFDALRVPQYGVAMLGKELTDQQAAQIIKAKPNLVLLCLDADAPQAERQVRGQLSRVVPEVLSFPLHRFGVKDLGAASMPVIKIVEQMCGGARHGSQEKESRSG